MSTRSIVRFQYTKKYCLWIKKKPGIATWLSDYSFLFSVIFFHVDICESYATLDTTKGKNREITFMLISLIFNITANSPTLAGRGAAPI